MPQKKKSVGRKVDKTGRSAPASTETKFVHIPDWERRSLAWRWLSRDHPRALLLYIEFKSYYNGSNNDGNLWLSQRDATRAIGGSRSTIHRSFKLLEDIGFLICNQRGKQVKRSAVIDDGSVEETAEKATTYFLTDVSLNDQYGRFVAEATKQFMSWQPPKRLSKPARKEASPKNATPPKNVIPGTVVAHSRYSGETPAPESHHSTEPVA